MTDSQETDQCAGHSPKDSGSRRTSSDEDGQRSQTGKEDNSDDLTDALADAENTTAEDIENGADDIDIDSPQNSHMTESQEKTPEEMMAQYSDKECDYDNHVQGTLSHGDTEQYPVVEALLADVNEHGECHVTVEDHEKRLEMRQGNSYFNFERGVIQIDTTKGFSHLLIPMDRVISWEKPMGAWES